MNARNFPAVLVALIACFQLSMNTADAQREPLPPSGSAAKIYRPDRALIDRIRADFEKLPTVLEAEYEFKGRKYEEHGPGFLTPPPRKFLTPKLAGAAAKFIEGRGIESTRRCDIIFALWPYVESSRDKEAFVILLAITRELYAYDFAPGRFLPFSTDFNEDEWQAKRQELLGHLKKATLFVLKTLKEAYGYEFDVNGLASEKLPAKSSAKAKAGSNDGGSGPKTPLLAPSPPKPPDSKTK